MRTRKDRPEMSRQCRLALCLYGVEGVTVHRAWNSRFRVAIVVLCRTPQGGGPIGGAWSLGLRLRLRNNHVRAEQSGIRLNSRPARE